MKNIKLLIIINLIISINVFSQQFTKITNTPPVTVDLPAFTCAWADYDNDGYLDLFVGNAYSPSTSNSLYHNNGDETFTRDSESIISNEVGTSWGCTWGDYNNDGFVDLYVVNGNNMPNFFYVNNGDGSFTKNTTAIIATDAEYSAMGSWVDYNNDGSLDLYVSNCYLSSPYVELNSLYYQSDGEFIKITEGAIATDIKNSHGMCWVDYDNDGDSDCFIASQSGNTQDIYQNNGDGTFTHITEGAIPETTVNGGGFSFADIDNDEDMDAFLTVINGNNKLFINNGDGTFTEVTQGDIVNDGMPSYCAGFADYDNDGDVDLVVSNVQPSNPQGTYALLYSNNGNGTFTKVTDEIIVTEQGQGGGVTWGDYDRDGDLDLYMTRYGEQNGLYRNNGNSNHWINIKLIGTSSNKSGIGAKVKINTMENGIIKWQMREVFGETGYQSQNSLNVHFGLGTHNVIDCLVVEWPSGITDFFFDVEADQFLNIAEGTGVGINVKKREDAIKIFPNPANESLIISFPNRATSECKIYLIDCYGKMVKYKSINGEVLTNYKINLSAIRAGVYTLVVIDGVLWYTDKVVVAR